MYNPKIVKPLVYVAGPYSSPDPVENTHRAIKVGMELYDSGKCAVIVPHLSLISHLVTPRPPDYWYEWDIDQLMRCHALYRMTGDSVGADHEVDVCYEHGIPVFFEEHPDGKRALLDFCDIIIDNFKVRYDTA